MPTYKQERRLQVDGLSYPYRTLVCRRVATFPEQGLNQSVDGTAQGVTVMFGELRSCESVRIAWTLC